MYRLEPADSHIDSHAILFCVETAAFRQLEDRSMRRLVKTSIVESRGISHECGAISAMTRMPPGMTRQLRSRYDLLITFDALSRAISSISAVMADSGRPRRVTATIQRRINGRSILTRTS
jgi:hypothetical protein